MGKLHIRDNAHALSIALHVTAGQAAHRSSYDALNPGRPAVRRSRHHLQKRVTPGRIVATVLRGFHLRWPAHFSVPDPHAVWFITSIGSARFEETL